MTLATSLLQWHWWHPVLYTLVLTHITIISVTVTCTAIRRIGRWTCILPWPISFGSGSG